jgi:porin
MSVAALLAVGLALPVAVHAEEAVPSRDIADVLHDLAGQGVYTRLNYVDAMAANLQGGQRYEVANSGVAMFGADFDLAKLIEMPDAQLHVSFAQLYGRDLASDAIGARLKLQNYSYPHEQFELTSLAYEHGIWNDRLNLLVGRTAATAEFARSTYACQFNSAVDCPMMLTQLVGGLPGFPYVNWGGRLRAELAENISAKVGAYQINPTRQYQTGFDWGTQTSTGYVVPFELGY